MGNLVEIIGAAVNAQGYELVDVELPRGMIRVYIDQPTGISVEDCEKVSNHLTRVFAVEGIEFDRLEVSSPGLDRALKSVKDFERFQGAAVRVRLSGMVEGRKRFDAQIGPVGRNHVEFVLIDRDAAPAKPGRKPKKAAAQPAANEHRLTVPLELIERARLIPDL